MTAYDVDFHAWALEQAELLKRRSSNEIDWDNVAEELEDLGTSQVKELRSRLVILLTHLLKWAYQAERRSRSWSATIAIQRADIAEHLAGNPSLKAKQAEAFSSAYKTARLQASGETDLPVDTFPAEPPFSLEEAKSEAWLPESFGGQD